MNGGYRYPFGPGAMPGMPWPGGYMASGYPAPAMPPMYGMPAPWSHDPFPEADPRVPPAGWEQTPQSRAQYERTRNENKTVRWGDVVLLNFPPLGGGAPAVQPVPQFADFWLAMPAACLIRLSAQELDATAINPADLITWTLLIGVGNATAKKVLQTVPDDANGTTNHDLLLTLPLEHLTVEASAAIVQNAPGGVNRIVQISAQIAPFTSYGGLVRAP